MAIVIITIARPDGLQHSIGIQPSPSIHIHTPFAKPSIHKCQREDWENRPYAIMP